MRSADHDRATVLTYKEKGAPCLIHPPPGMPTGMIPEKEREPLPAGYLEHVGRPDETARLESRLLGSAGKQRAPMSPSSTPGSLPEPAPMGA